MSPLKHFGIYQNISNLHNGIYITSQYFTQCLSYHSLSLAALRAEIDAPRLVVEVVAESRRSRRAARFAAATNKCATLRQHGSHHAALPPLRNAAAARSRLRTEQLHRLKRQHRPS